MSQPIEITRELLERYLRATGWKIAAKKDAAVRWDRGDSWYWWCASETTEQAIDAFESHDGYPRPGIRFRLGLCAAAEMLLDSAGDARSERNETLLCEEYERLLRAAGIDPAAWEAAR